MKQLKKGTKVRTTRNYDCYNEYSKEGNKDYDRLIRIPKGEIGTILKKDKDGEKFRKSTFNDDDIEAGLDKLKLYTIEFKNPIRWIGLVEGEFEVIKKGKKK